MIKLILFDLDGVLVDTKMIHYHALNKALEDVDEKYIISLDDHLRLFDGLPTTDKLSQLTHDRGLPVEKHDQIYFEKQKYTIKQIIHDIHIDYRLYTVLEKLRSDGYLLGCASNCSGNTLRGILFNLGIIELFDIVVSKNDVKKHKPNPEMYLRCMAELGIGPHDTLILEDSPVGLRAAHTSGANVYRVDNSSDVTYENIHKQIRNIDSKNEFGWVDGKMNVLIPMAGRGSRFEQAGYTFPKPLIQINNKPMIQVVVDSLGVRGNFIYLAQKEHCLKYNIPMMMNQISRDAKVLEVDGVTEGAACTTLLAKELIDNDNPLLIANSDQYIEWDTTDFFYLMNNHDYDAGILCFESVHPKWSYAEVDENNLVLRVAEKEPISNHATVGVYYWKRGSDYVKYAEQMIKKNIRVNNEFYVCPVFNEAIHDGLKVRAYFVDKMAGLGTPEDLDAFLKDK